MGCIERVFNGVEMKKCLKCGGNVKEDTSGDWYCGSKNFSGCGSFMCFNKDGKIISRIGNRIGNVWLIDEGRLLIMNGEE